MSSPLLSTIRAYVDARGGGEACYEMPVSGVHILCARHRVPANHMLYRPSLCIVVQGAKQIRIGEDTLHYGAMQCLIVSMELPACGQVLEASPDLPFLGMTIDLDVPAMRDVLGHLDTPPDSGADAGRGVFVADVDDPLAECVLRLFRLSETPKAIPVLYPSIMREIYYRLLTGPNGGHVRKLAMPDAHMDRVAKAIQLLRDRYAETLRVDQLAEAARMSPSSFHQHFKALTSMTPLQFQKQLRLLEARRLMVAEAANVAEAAYKVGYESASQFSREYSRMFNAAPKRDVMNIRAEAA